MKTFTFLSSLLLCIVIAHAQSQISGPDLVCPNFSYTFSSSSTVPGCWYWFVFEPGDNRNPVVPSGSSCIASTSSNGTLWFNDVLGIARVVVGYRDPVFGRVTYRTLYVTKRVHGPGKPYDLDGGDQNDLHSGCVTSV